MSHSSAPRASSTPTADGPSTKRRRTTLPLPVPTPTPDPLLHPGTLMSALAVGRDDLRRLTQDLLRCDREIAQAERTAREAARRADWAARDHFWKVQHKWHDERLRIRDAELRFLAMREKAMDFVPSAAALAATAAAATAAAADAPRHPHPAVADSTTPEEHITPTPPHDPNGTDANSASTGRASHAFSALVPKPHSESHSEPTPPAPPPPRPSPTPTSPLADHPPAHLPAATTATTTPVTPPPNIPDSPPPGLPVPRSPTQPPRQGAAAAPPPAPLVRAKQYVPDRAGVDGSGRKFRAVTPPPPPPPPPRGKVENVEEPPSPRRTRSRSASQNLGGMASTPAFGDDDEHRRSGPPIPSIRRTQSHSSLATEDRRPATAPASDSSPLPVPVPSPPSAPVARRSSPRSPGVSQAQAPERASHRHSVAGPAPLKQAQPASKPAPKVLPPPQLGRTANGNANDTANVVPGQIFFYETTSQSWKQATVPERPGEATTNLKQAPANANAESTSANGRGILSRSRSTGSVAVAAKSGPDFQQSSQRRQSVPANGHAQAKQLTAAVAPAPARKAPEPSPKAKTSGTRVPSRPGFVASGPRRVLYPGSSHWLLYVRAYQRHDVHAVEEIGYRYEFGHDMPKDLLEAARWYRRGLELGEWGSTKRLHTILQNSNNSALKGEQTQAIRAYRLAHEKNTMEAWAAVRYALAFPHNGSQKFGRLFSTVYDVCARFPSFAQARSLLGQCYESALGTQRNVEMAIVNYSASAQLGHAMGMCGLAGLIDQVEHKFQLHKQAASQGCALSQCSLGYYFEQGRGVTKDLSMAIYWYNRAAAQGCAVAQCNLWICYSQGIGVARNMDIAKLWLTRAAHQGDTEARKHLKIVR